MGAGLSQSDPDSTQMTNFDAQNEHYDEFMQTIECCGIKIRKKVRFTLIWEEALIDSCQDLKSQYPGWTEQIIAVVKEKQLIRSKYVKEIYDLKSQQLQPAIHEQEILLTPSEIDDFKRNLRQSVLLSYGQCKQNRQPRDTKIKSMVGIITPRTANSRKKTQQILSQFRQSSIVRRSDCGLEFDGQSSSVRTDRSSNFRESMISFIDDTMSSLFRGQSQDISKKNAHSLEVFIAFTFVLEKHLKDPLNKLFHVVRSFKESLYRKFGKEVASAEQLESLTNNVKIFLILLRDSIEDYYYTKSFADLNDNNNFLISNSENVLTAATSILFKDDRFYNFMLQHVTKFYHERDASMRTVVDNLKDKPPQYFQIKPEYCLNDYTMQKHLEKKRSPDSPRVQLGESEEYPYSTGVDILKRLQQMKAPISKMKLILETAESITKSISKYYDSHNMESESRVLDADQILSIFSYMVCRAQVANLHSHLFILEHFATENQLISMMGYYYSVLSCALENLERNLEHRT